MRHRLFDIDVVIKKTVVFTVIAGVLVTLYLGVIPLATVGTASRLLVGAILLIATFTPVRRAARSLADRIVYGRRASSYEVLADFSERMGETYATDDVLPRMAEILARATDGLSHHSHEAFIPGSSAHWQARDRPLQTRKGGRS